MTDDLVLRLRRIKDESRRTLRELERATHISNSALSRYLSGQSTPPWNAVVALCGATGADPRPLRPLWEQAQRTRRAPGRAFDVNRHAGAATAPDRQRTPRNDLPRDVATFTGRENETAELLRLARDGRAVVVDGMGGVGKTALAVHAAHRLAGEFADCQLYVDLHGFTPGREPLGPGEALLSLVRALEVPAGRIPDGVEERAALWRSELTGRRAVVVLDNAADADQVRPLLPGAGRHAVFVTSRRRLVDLDGVEPVSLTPLSAADAAGLFSATLGGGAASPDPEGPETPALATLMERCGGLPLAIRIAAAHLRHHPSWTVSDLLDRRPADEIGVDRVVAGSLARLSTRQRGMFLVLGLHPGADFDPPAVAALAGLPADVALALLDDLVDAHLLEEPSVKRYRFHDIIRQRARDAARTGMPQADRDAALDRLTDYYLHAVTLGKVGLEWSVDHVKPVRHPPSAVPGLDSPPRIMSWYDAEAATIRQVFDLAVERGRDDLVVQFALMIGAFLGRSGEMDLWHRFGDAGVDAARRRGNVAEESAVRYFRGIAHRFTGRLDEAESDFAAVAELAVGTDDTGMRILSLRRLSSIAGDRGEFARVLDLRREIHELPGTDSFPLHLAFTAVATARSLIHLGRAAEAVGEMRLVLADAEDPALRINALRALGHALLAEGDAAAALEAFHDAVATSRETGHASYVAVCRGDAAEASSRLGRHVEALDEHEAAVTWAADNGELHREISLREAFGRTCLAAGDLDRAREQFRLSLASAEPRGFRYIAAMARLGLARTLRSSDASARLRDAAVAALDALGVPIPEV